MTTQSEIELAWAAGFFDGEGNTCYTRLAGKRRGNVRLTIGQAGDPDDPGAYPEVLERFLAAVGVGHIYGPYLHSNPRAKPVYQYQVYRATARQVYELLKPHLSTVKCAQAESAILRDDADIRLIAESPPLDKWERAWVTRRANASRESEV
jgi:hypothetical protein